MIFRLFLISVLELRECAGQGNLGARRNREVPDGPPSVRLVEVPVTDRVDRQQSAHSAEQCCQRIGLRTRSAAREPNVFCPHCIASGRNFACSLAWLDRFQQP